MERLSIVFCDCAQTNIISDGFRSLAEGEQVEFVVDQSDDGRAKAIEVTGPNGGNPQVRNCFAVKHRITSHHA